MQSTRSAVVAFLCAVVALFVGIWLGGHPESLPDPIRDTFVDEDRALRAEVVDTIKDNFYKPVNEDKLDDASLKGIVDAVNGRSIAGVNSEVATGRIKGPSGTSVSLEVFTPGDARPRTVSVKRARIEVPVASGRIVRRDGHKVGVVELISFSSGAHGLLRQQVRKVLNKGAEGIVLDLRGNGGGLLTEAVLVSSIFIEDGKIVSVRGRARPERVEEAEGDAIDENGPGAAPPPPRGAPRCRAREARPLPRGRAAVRAGPANGGRASRRRSRRAGA